MLIYMRYFIVVVNMLRKTIIFFILIALSFQTLGTSFLHKNNHLIQSFSHDALHFWGEPHTHNEKDPQNIQLEFSAEARKHISCDVSATQPALLQPSMLKCQAVLSRPNKHLLQVHPDPFLHHTTPPPKA